MNIIYVVGPYRASTTNRINSNIRHAQLWASAINLTGLAFALCPHSLSDGIQASLSDQAWVDFTLEVSKRCDGLLLLPGWDASEGSLGEWGAAVDSGKPWVAGGSLASVMDSVRALNALIEDRRRREEITEVERSAPWSERLGIQAKIREQEFLGHLADRLEAIK